MKELGTDTVRSMATVKLMKAAYGIYSKNASMGYLGPMEGDDSVAARQRRSQYRGTLPEWEEGRSLTSKARVAWNALSTAGLQDLKEISTANKFERAIKQHLPKIKAEFERRWMMRG